VPQIKNGEVWSIWLKINEVELNRIGKNFITQNSVLKRQHAMVLMREEDR